MQGIYLWTAKQIPILLSLVWADRVSELTFYRTWGEHVKHYTTDAVLYKYIR
jgi:hypothetical protein